MDTPATYLHWSFILISVPNAALILGMVTLFVVALLAPFPGHRRHHDSEEAPTDE